MRFTSLFLFVIFLLFCAVQYNDPDPHVWVPIYGYVAAMCWMSFKSKFNYYLLAAGTIFFFAGGIYQFPPSVMEYFEAEVSQKSIGMEMIGVEEAREAGGLLLGGFTMLLLGFFGWKKNSGEKNQPKKVLTNMPEKADV